MAVKGSKQHQMVVVPHRPYHKISLLGLCFFMVVVFGWLTFDYGVRQGLETKVEVVNERDELQQQLSKSTHLVRSMRREVAELKLGGQIDSKATEEVRVTVEELQQQIAELKEETRFYKGVMLPNVEEKGLRIERLDMRPSNGLNKYKLNLLLTQIVEKHEYVQGRVKINLVGREDDGEKQYSLTDLSVANKDSIRFRFRYFQNISSELVVPEGFEPSKIMIVAQSSGQNSQRLEKKFDWQVGGD